MVDYLDPLRVTEPDALVMEALALAVNAALDQPTGTVTYNPAGSHYSWTITLNLWLPSGQRALATLDFYLADGSDLDARVKKAKERFERIRADSALAFRGHTAVLWEHGA